MQQYLRNAPARRLTYCKSVVYKLWLVAFVVMVVVAYTHAAYAFTLLFDQSAYRGDVWIQVQDPNYATTTANFIATYANGTKSIDFNDSGNQVIMSKPVKLSDIGAGGLTITRSVGAVFFVFYDDPASNSRTAPPNFMVSTQRFEPFELTMNGGDGDQGNLTDINYFTASLSIRSYQNNPIQNPAEPVVQQTGFGHFTTAQIGARLAAASKYNSQAVVKDANGGIIRYLGPSNTFSSGNPWPSFIPYSQAVNQAGQNTAIQPNPQGFYFKADNTPVYNFGANMTATANADGSLTVTGAITASVTGTIKTGNPPLPAGGQWTDATFSFSVSNPEAFNSAIYGQAQTSAVSFSGTGWTNFQTFCQNTLLDPTQPYNPTTNPSLLDANAANANPYDTAIANFIGEVTTGLLGGFFNSDYQVSGVALKNMPSHQWWSLNPMVAYKEIQPQNPYYNLYAAVIFDTSSNTVYGVPYSDRFGNGPLVNTVKYNGANVNYWVLGIGAPLPAITSPGILLLLLLGN